VARTHRPRSWSGLALLFAKTTPPDSGGYSEEQGFM
jgi:hypothetical protein